MERRPVAIALAAVLTLAAAGPATPAEAVDPMMLGQAGGIRYASRSTTYGPVSGDAEVEVGCGHPGWHLIGGGSRAGGDPSVTWNALGRPFDDLDDDDVPDDGWLAGGVGADPARFTGYSICIRNTDLRYRWRIVTGQPTGDRAARINCGARWAATSGGPSISTADSWIHSSLPHDGSDVDTRPDDGWEGTAWDTAGGAGAFSVHVVCTDGHRVRYVKRAPLAVPPTGTRDRRVACRNDEHVVGGGARLSGAADLGRLVSSFPYDGKDPDAVPDDGWQVRVHNVGGNAKKAAAFAVCLS